MKSNTFTSRLLLLSAFTLIPSLLSPLSAEEGRTNTATAVPSPVVQILQNGGFTEGNSNWELEQIAPAKGTFEITTDGPSGASCAKVELTEPGDEHWKMSFLQKGLHLLKSKNYKITFRARASEDRWVYVGFKQHLEPYKSLGGKNDIHIGTDWTEISLVIKPTDDEANARFSIGNLGKNPGTLWFADFSIIEE